MRHYLTLFLCGAAFHASAQQAYDPAATSQRLFDDYKANIARTKDAAVNAADPVVGDLNGDGRADCLISLVLTPKEGGNAIIGYRTAVYLNTGKGMKVAGAFPDLNYCYGVKNSRAGIINVEEIECAPPYMTPVATHRYRWQRGRLVAVK